MNIDAIQLFLADLGFQALEVSQAHPALSPLAVPVRILGALPDGLMTVSRISLAIGFAAIAIAVTARAGRIGRRPISFRRRRRREAGPPRERSGQPVPA